jgi:hypothetical protein
MTDLERRVRESIISAAEGSASEPPDAAHLLAQAHNARTARRRTAMAGIAAVVILMLSLVVALADREDRGGSPAASPSPSPSTNPIPAGWKVLEDSVLRMSVPPGTLVNPTVCPYDGRSYVLTVGRRCGGPTTGGSWKQAPVVIWFLGGDSRMKPPPAHVVLQTLNRDGLSGFVEPMLDPGFNPGTKGATYTWTLAENTTTTTIYLFGTDPGTAQQVIDSLRLAGR